MAWASGASPGASAGAGRGGEQDAFAGISVFGGEPGPGVGGAGGGAAVASEAHPIHMLHPENGRFDIVVVQSGGNGVIPGSEGVIQGRPIFTVYLAVGAPKEWILQYAVPGGEAASPQAGQVVSLENPAPVEAPYPIETLVPASLQGRRRGFLLIHGTVDREGRCQGLKIVSGAPAGVEGEALAALRQWRFRPATRDGAPVMVEFLLAIPPTPA